ncbi:MAG: tetratricopeptide repeat protein [Chitinophagales bacterium]
MSSGENNKTNQANHLPAVSGSSLRTLGNQVQVLDNVLNERDPEYWVKEGLKSKERQQWLQVKYYSERALLIYPNFSKALILKAYACFHLNFDNSWHKDIIRSFTVDYIINSVKGRRIIYIEEWKEMSEVIPYPNSFEDLKNNVDFFLAFAICHYKSDAWFYGCRDWFVKEIEQSIKQIDPQVQKWLYLILSLFYDPRVNQPYDFYLCLEHANKYLLEAISIDTSFTEVYYTKAIYGIDIEDNIEKIIQSGVNISSPDLYFHLCEELEIIENESNYHHFLKANKKINQSWLNIYSTAGLLNKGNISRMHVIKLKQAKLNFALDFIEDALKNMNELKLYNFSFDIEHFYLLGNIYFQLGNFEEAINLFTKVIINSDSLKKEALKGRAEAYKRYGDIQRHQMDILELSSIEQNEDLPF